MFNDLKLQQTQMRKLQAEVASAREEEEREDVAVEEMQREVESMQREVGSMQRECERRLEWQEKTFLEEVDRLMNTFTNSSSSSKTRIGSLTDEVRILNEELQRFQKEAAEKEASHLATIESLRDELQQCREEDQEEAPLPAAEEPPVPSPTVPASTAGDSTAAFQTRTVTAGRARDSSIRQAHSSVLPMPTTQVESGRFLRSLKLIARGWNRFIVSWVNARGPSYETELQAWQRAISAINVCDL